MLDKKNSLYRRERMNWENIQDQWTELNEQITAYFSDLSTNEQYAWIAEALGVLLFVAGLILILI